MKKKKHPAVKEKKRSVAAPPGLHRLVHSKKLEQLQDKLREAQETLDAIRNGEVDAVVVSGAHGNQVYSLAGAEHPYRVYVEQMQEGAVTVAPDGLVLYCNQRLADMLNMPLERVISTKFSGYLSEDSWQNIAHVFKNGEGMVKHEAFLRGSNGDELPVYLTAKRFPIDGQDAMCLVVTDLTAHKEKTRLVVEKELAEKANATKDAFLAALSHELRTPLTPVLMSVTAMEGDKNLPEATRQEISMIRRNIELEARLIDDLLDLTRIARGKLELHVGPLDFHSILQRAIEICRTDSDAKKQIIHFHLLARKTRTEGDAVRLQQAIWNLMRNAVKFTPAGGLITVTTLDGPHDHIRLKIADTGIGFEESVSERLFKAFEQGDRNITRQFGGLGLGLAITQSIVRSHGGRVRGESKGHGKGATFTLDLPLRAPDPGQSSKSPEKAAAADSGKRSLRLLLVEDHQDTRKSMEFLLRRHKHQVTSAGNARDALELAAQHEFDLVISDLGLPDQSGIELMKQLRDTYGLQGIGVSGYGMEEDIAESHAAGFTCHLVKPVSIDQLRRAIAEVMNMA